MAQLKEYHRLWIAYYSPFPKAKIVSQRYHSFINFVEKNEGVTQHHFSFYGCNSLYTNIPQDTGIRTVCKAYDNIYKSNPPAVATRFLEQMLSIILQENFFELSGENYL